MAESSQPVELRAYLNNLMGRIDSIGEEELLAAYFQMQSYAELRPFFEQYEEQFIAALKRRDVPMLIGIMKKIEAGFTAGLSQEVIQVASQKERSLPAYNMEQDELKTRAREALQSMKDVAPLAQEIHRSRKETNRDFIGKLVKNYIELSAEQQSSLIESIDQQSESQPHAPAKQILQQAVAETLPPKSNAARSILNNKEIESRVLELQLSAPEIVEQRFARVFFESPRPIVARKAILEGIKTDSKTAFSLEAIIHRAKLVSTASAIIDGSSDAPPDYRSFFRDLAQDGGVKEKIIAPIADAVLSVVPKKTRETIVFSVMSSLWKKETAGGGAVQIALGALFGSDAVAQIIQKWNTKFFTAPSGRLITPAQSFVGDVITTVFRPRGFAKVWTEMVRVDATLLPTTAYQYYLSLSAKQVISRKMQTTGYEYVWSFLAKRGIVKGTSAVATQAARDAARLAIQKAGGKIITSTIGKSLGAFFGSFLGPGIGTFVGWLVGDIIIDKALSFVGRAVSGFFNLLSFKFLTDLMSGDVPTTPLWEQEGAKWLLIGAGVLLFIVLFPISLFGLTGANYQKLTDDNTFVQALGTGNEYQYADCENNPTDPLCSMTPCDPSVQDCDWPTSGTITQGPFTSCGGTHAYANAIDIGTSNGTDVYATIHGRVTRVFTGCPDYVGYLGNPCGGYLGNHIIIEGISPYDYTLKFGHLLSTSIRVSEGQEVFPNDVIGEVDNSGSSSGPHLHFSFIDNSGQNRSINSILPFAIDHCVNSAPGCTACNYPAVGGGGQ